MSNNERDELAAAFRRTEALGNEPIDRKGWTKKQWADDAERIMEHIDGSVTALVNGHALGLIARIRELTPRTITTVEELDKLPVDSVILDADHVACQRMKLNELWEAGGEIVPTELVPLPATVLYAPEPAL
ncbi:hypothetical protein [Arthrobacter sp. Soil763]|uniref:hypothetical protein n=1 Tax=Arthrobacter sp. Soil763 TaxID=1736402 RepID=UPI0006FC828D|nr:hypothetical protein [Arthrobacter sp. Soil763]KRE79964.1 hypothetical protein ASG71_07980 [Arthrobacter sp. Soil763]